MRQNNECLFKFEYTSHGELNKELPIHYGFSPSRLYLSSQDTERDGDSL